MRGLPGSGKTTLALTLSKNVYATDDFFMNDGVYVFDYNKISEAHIWNQNRVNSALESELKTVVVDNTNICAWEMKPYALMGYKNDYSILLVESDAEHKWDIKRLAEINSHKVPIEIIEKMYRLYQPDLTLDLILNAVNPNK